MTTTLGECRSIVRASFAYHLWGLIGSVAGIPVYIRTKPFRAIALFAVLQIGCLVVSEVGRRIDAMHYLTLGLAETTVFILLTDFLHETQRIQRGAAGGEKVTANADVIASNDVLPKSGNVTLRLSLRRGEVFGR